VSTAPSGQGRTPADGGAGGGGNRDGLSCEETFHRLDDYIDRELSSLERERVERHLAFCAECASEYRFEASLIRSLRAKLDGLQMPSRLVDEVKALLDAETKKSGA
jgi:predicted anti-sigma-YlaC factor YlaD